MTEIKSYRIPVDVIAAACKALGAGKIKATILDGSEDEGIIQVRIEYQNDDPLHKKVMSDILSMIREYNAYRYDKKD